MDITEALKARRTIRAFKPDPLDKETVVKILEPALRTPSWANTQPWQVYVAGGDVTERLRQSFFTRFMQGVPRAMEVPTPQGWPPAILARLQELGTLRQQFLGLQGDEEANRRSMQTRNFTLFGAPVVVYLCMDRTLTSWSMFDLGATQQSIMLSALHYGVGSAPAVNLVAYPDLIRAELGIPQDLAIVFGIALGWPDETDPNSQFISPRRPFDEVVSFSGF